LAAERRTLTDFISPIEELLDDARAGRMFILVDDEDRENEGDLVIPAQFATPDAVNFMATARPRPDLPRDDPVSGCDHRGACPLMSAEQRFAASRRPFTVSIEARDGVSTGISAADRSRTDRGGHQPGHGAGSISFLPGMSFRSWLVRAARWCAPATPRRRWISARLAGPQSPAGVICEIMNDDGTMARLPDLDCLFTASITPEAWAPSRI
jgi:3,4-dihydroxy 2-butanone 4-phosphate synthase/GTP cyclohydrolase II